MKKKSSTLGINKTSESPPTLRRDYALENGWNTFDHRLRGSTTSSINGDNFQRNATYRSSLQTLPTSNVSNKIIKKYVCFLHYFNVFNILHKIYK